MKPSSLAIRRLVPSLAIAGGLALLAGCRSAESYAAAARSGSDSAVSSAPGAATADAASTIIVAQAPPAPRAEVAQPRPSSAHVWIAGYWAWRDNHYEWIGGHWEVPPRTDAVWVKPRWQSLGDGSYRFTEGYWS